VQGDSPGVSSGAAQCSAPAFLAPGHTTQQLYLFKEGFYPEQKCLWKPEYVKCIIQRAVSTAVEKLINQN